MATKGGTTYNAYLIQGEKTALIDGAKKQFQDEWFANIESLTSVDSIDYLIVNHTEPDHSGSYLELLKRNPNIKIICSASAVPFVKNVLNTEADITGIKDNHELDLGGKKLIFKLTPYMHWPDTMMEFLEEDGILFSCDGFAAHISNEQLFDTELPESADLDFEIHYYYDAIMRPFSGYIRRNLPKLDGFDIKMIATSHGPVLKDNPRQHIEKYAEWVTERYDQDVAIFFASNYGNTAGLAGIMEEELNKAVLTTTMIDVTESETELQRDTIEHSRAVLIGTPTFNGDAVPPIWDFVNNFATVYSIGKKASAFGSYGWGGEGTKLVLERLKGLKLKTTEEPFRARLIPSDDDISGARTFAKEFAEFVGPAK
jgi:flavorubredoxin